MRFSKGPTPLRITWVGQDGRPSVPTQPVTPGNFTLRSDGVPQATPGQWCIYDDLGAHGLLWVTPDLGEAFFAEGSEITALADGVEIEDVPGHGGWVGDSFVVGDYPVEFVPIGANRLTVHCTHNGDDVAMIGISIRRTGYRGWMQTDGDGVAWKDLAPTPHRVVVLGDGMYESQTFDDVDLSLGDVTLEVELEAMTIPDPDAEGLIVAYFIAKRHGQPLVGVPFKCRLKEDPGDGTWQDTTPMEAESLEDGMVAFTACEPETTYVIVPPYGNEVEFTTGTTSPHLVKNGNFFQNS